MVPTLYIKKEDKNEIPIESIRGLHFLKLSRLPPQLVTNYQTIQGRDGEIINGNFNYGPTTVTADFYFDGQDESDFSLGIHEIYELFSDRKPLRLRDSMEPGIVMYAVPQSYEMTVTNFVKATFSIPFDVPGAFRQSLFRSDDPRLFKTGAWQFGMNLLSENTQYSFNSSNFTVYNASDVDVEPYKQGHDLVITVKAVGNPTIKNKTTGKSITLNKTMAAGDVFVLNGIVALFNGKECTKDTDWGDIDLKVGKNHFEVTGCTSIDYINFSFPFLYK